MEINITRDRQVVVSVTTTLKEFTDALRAGRLVIDLKGAPALSEGLARAPGGVAEAGLGAGEVAAICRRYGPERLAANLLWEIAQAGDEGITSTELKEILGLSSSQKLAGVFGGLGKTASLFMRGLEARHTLLLVDGVRVGSATVGTPSLDNLPLEAIERIESSGLEGVVVTNTIPLDERRSCKKLTLLSVAPLLGEAIDRIHRETSVSSLFV